MSATKLIFQSEGRSGSSTLRAADGPADAAALRPWQEELRKRQLELLNLDGREFRFRTPLQGWPTAYGVRVVDEGPKRAKTVELHPLGRELAPPLAGLAAGWPEEFVSKLRESFGRMPTGHDKAACVDMVLSQVEDLGRERPGYLALLLLKGYLHEACGLFASRPEEVYRLGFYKIVEQLLERLEEGESEPEPAGEVAKEAGGSWISRMLARILGVGSDGV